MRTLIHPRLRIYLLKPVSKYVRTAPTYARCTSLATVGAWRCKNANNGLYFMNSDDCKTLKLVVMLVRIGVSIARKWVRSFVAAWIECQTRVNSTVVYRDIPLCGGLPPPLTSPVRP